VTATGGLTRLLTSVEGATQSDNVNLGLRYPILSMNGIERATLKELESGVLTWALKNGITFGRVRRNVVVLRGLV
jgi:hypothetical protein